MRNVLLKIIGGSSRNRNSHHEIFLLAVFTTIVLFQFLTCLNGTFMRVMAIKQNTVKRSIEKSKLKAKVSLLHLAVIISL